MLHISYPFWKRSSPNKWEQAAQAVDTARGLVASAINAGAKKLFSLRGDRIHIIFSCWASQAIAHRRRIVISAIEHEIGARALSMVKKNGFEVITIPVTRDGVVDLQELMI